MIRLWPVSAMKRRLPVASASDLAGIQQRAVRGALHLRGEVERSEVQLALGLVLFDELADRPVDVS